MRSSPWRSALFLAAAGLALPVGYVVVHSLPAKGEHAARAPEEAVRPITNDCSAGHVEFTFDDGPGIHSRAMLDKLNALHLTATFFVIGQNVVQGGKQAAAVLRDEIASGDTVGNHSWDHPSFTGESTKTAPLSKDQIVQELNRATQAIVATGVRRPTLYRPPYGDIDAQANEVARGLGYRLVSPWGAPGTNILDSKDWSGISTQQIISNVVNGYVSDGAHYNGIKDQTIVLMHDGGRDDTLHSIEALQPIVDYMNAHHLCSTATIRADATGGRVPLPPQPEPGAGRNLVPNASLEKSRGGGPSTAPSCFEQAAGDAVGGTARWSRVADAHTGTAAERVVVSGWRSGDRKLLLSRSPADSACHTTVKPGTRYGTWLWYRGNWAAGGKTPTQVGIVAYYRQASGAWQYWQSGRSVEPSAGWKLTDFVTDPLPAGATAISFGLAISGNGTLTTDDYSMAAQ